MTTVFQSPVNGVNQQGGSCPNSEGASSNSKKTIYPGMADQQVPVDMLNRGARNTPLVGFLFSVSRTAFGEYWPLYAGKNTIGRSSESMVCLSDPQVSEEHAMIVVQDRFENNHKAGVTVYLRDNASTTGTMLNKNSVMIDPLVCKHGDIINIGPNYELYLILVDVALLGLTQNPNLRNVEVEQPIAQNPVPFEKMGFYAGGGQKGTVLQDANGMSNPLTASNPTIFMSK